MKSRRSLVINRPIYSLCSTQTPNKRYTFNFNDQENIPPIEHGSLKKRKLYNGTAMDTVTPISLSSPKLVHKSSAGDYRPKPIKPIVPHLTTAIVGNADYVMADDRNRPRLPDNVVDQTLIAAPKSVVADNTRAAKPTIQEVMKDIVLYIEVMTIDEDRSEKIKLVASAMGAKVNDKLYKNTTHVVFREGSVTTYKKAVKIGVPLVSVSWLEECRKTLSVADPIKFQPINLDPYIRPELYKRIRKPNANTTDEVIKTPERFALKPQKPGEELDRRLLEYHQNLHSAQSPIPTHGHLTATVLKFSPIGESAHVGGTSKTPTKSNVTPLLKRLMIRNAEEDKRDRNRLLYGRLATAQQHEMTKNDSVSMDISHGMKSQQENSLCASPPVTVNFATNSPNETDPNSKLHYVNHERTENRRKTMFFSNANMEISPAAIKENVAVLVNSKSEEEVAPNLSLEIIEDDKNVAEASNVNKMPKICAVQKRASTEEDTLRDDIMRTKKELLNKSIIIDSSTTSHRRRSLLPCSDDELSRPKSRRLTTIYSNKSTESSNITKRRTLMPASDRHEDFGIPAVKKSKKEPTTRTAMGPPPPNKAADTKRKLFSSSVQLSPVASPAKQPLPPQSHTLKKFRAISKPLSPSSVVALKEKLHMRACEKSRRRSTLDFQTKATSNGTFGQSNPSNGSIRTYNKNVIVLTNAQQLQVNFVKELIQRLGDNFEYDTRVSSRTTHLIVCAGRKRNMNVLRGLIRGVWILDYKWIEKAHVEGRWFREEDFEISDFKTTVSKVRSERQAFGSSYKMSIFSGVGHFFLYETAVPSHHLRELITLCGGTVSSNAEKAKYLIGDSMRPGLHIISPTWLFDSITKYSFLNHKKFIKK